MLGLFVVSKEKTSPLSSSLSLSLSLSFFLCVSYLLFLSLLHSQTLSPFCVFYSLAPTHTHTHTYTHTHTQTTALPSSGLRSRWRAVGIMSQNLTHIPEGKKTLME